MTLVGWGNICEAFLEKKKRWENQYRHGYLLTLRTLTHHFVFSLVWVMVCCYHCRGVQQVLLKANCVCGSCCADLIGWRGRTINTLRHTIRQNQSEDKYTFSLRCRVNLCIGELSSAQLLNDLHFTFRMSTFDNDSFRIISLIHCKILWLWRQC